ncbi:MAG: ECF-type sigma factor [Acidobacteriota bacterium]
MPSLSERQPVTQWLHRWNEGDPLAQQAVFDHVYRELRRTAGGYFRNERSGHTLQPTEVVHEACVRLLAGSKIAWQSRSHFFGFAARVMRQVLVDYSRERKALKRGGQRPHITLPLDLHERTVDHVEILALDRALTMLEELAPEQARIVEARYFAGLSVAECAEALAISPTTVKRQWRRARAWLHAELTTEGYRADEP